MKPYQDKTWLEEQYLKKRRSCQSIGYECGVSRMTIHRWLRHYRIKTRSIREARQSKGEMTMEEALDILNEYSLVGDLF